MKKIILFFFFILLLNGAFAQSKRDWRPNRYYLEIGPVFGINRFYHKKFDDRYFYSSDGIGSSGIDIAAVTGGTWYQFKCRFFYLYNDYEPTSWMGGALLFGFVKHYQYTAFDFDIGLGYQTPTYRTDNSSPGNTSYINHTQRQIGIATEAHFQIITTPVGFSPFFFGNINLKAYSIGFGIDIMFGKTGYNKKEWRQLTATNK